MLLVHLHSIWLSCMVDWALLLIGLILGSTKVKMTTLSALLTLFIILFKANIPIRPLRKLPLTPKESSLDMSSQLDQDEYMFNRGYQDSARFVLEHWLWLWLHRLRYILHPSILISAPNLKIADVWTGNAIWIMELLHHLPPTARVDGFDISASHYPAKEWLPPNVALDLLDAFEDLPENLLGRYDVHMRTFAVIVRNNDPTRLLENLIKMLGE